MPEGQTALERIQAAILALEELEPIAIPPGDRSIQIHRCHSPMREMEVLHDQLLDMFERYPDLKPEQVVVMAPDIDRYAPYVQAVFGTQPTEFRRIPYTIADRSARRNSRFLEGFFALLELRKSRLSTLDVMNLLDYPGYKERFGISESELGMMERWIEEAGIRWGIDAENRRELGLPAYPENTWKFGIHRLLLGYAMPGGGRELFGNILPYDAIEGSEARTLGKLIAFTDKLFDWLRRLGRPQSLFEWKALLYEMLEQMMLPDEDGSLELQALRQAIENLAGQGIDGGFEEPVSLEVFQACLAAQLTHRGAGSGFLAGGVTFCAMLPMRSIPARVVCMIGMDNEHFPRHSQDPTFDLIAKYPRRGDRSRRNDDKYLFLESLLSSRLIYYISYLGLNTQNNDEIEPSVLVSELIDCLESAFIAPVTGQSVRSSFETNHRLQAFSPGYFEGDKALFSYSVENRDAARRHVQPSRPRAFFPAPLPPGAEEVRDESQIDVNGLALFFGHPARFLLQHRLELRLDPPATSGNDREQFVPRGLERYQIEQDVFEARLADGIQPDGLAVQKAAGRLPHGRVGEVVYDRIRRDVEEFVEKLRELPPADRLQSLEVDLAVGGSALTGRLQQVGQTGLIDVRFARQRARDLLRTWIRHLAFCQANPPGVEPQSFLLTKTGGWHMSAPQAAQGLLADLVDIFRRGMTEPLPFFPESAYQYALQKIQRGKSDVQALQYARGTWEGAQRRRGESDDPYYRLCFENRDPIGEDFAQLSERVYGPLLAHCRQTGR
jgi:exodeoxyribonuclease V gamma subunit